MSSSMERTAWNNGNMNFPFDYKWIFQKQSHYDVLNKWPHWY
jgi:hypothetical protein